MVGTRGCTWIISSNCKRGEALAGGFKRLAVFFCYTTGMTQNTYLFYDLETSGLNPAFDQVYQFAGIRTDLALNEIERYDFLVKPTIDVIPAPEAMITHRLSIELLQNQGEPEHLVIQKIHQLLNAPGTISLGYNTLTFDDEFLRFNFYRHLLTPYTHQFANQCRRMDLFPMAVFYWLFRRDHLVWGEREDRVSLKLEDLSHKNQLATGQAHNAIVDVEATIELARRFKQDPKMWDYLIDYFVKPKDSERLGALPLVSIANIQYPTGIAVEGKYGSKQSFQVPVLGLGQHWHYANQTVWLKLDDERILKGDEALIPEIWTIKKRLAEPPFILEPKERFNLIDANRQKLSAEILKFLQNTPHFFEAMKRYALDFKFPTYPQTDIDAALYQNKFWSDQDVFAMKRFWEADPQEKMRLSGAFQRKELQELSLRFLGRFYPEVLSEGGEKAFAEYLKAEALDYKLNPRLTRSLALERIAAIDLTKLDPEQQTILAGLKTQLEAQTV